jgi:hypothetical protein
VRLTAMLLIAFIAIAGGDAQARREFQLPADKSAGPRVDRVDILAKGIFQAHNARQTQNVSSPTGTAHALTAVRIVKDSDVIQARIGVHFGINYVIRGFPVGTRVSIKVIQRYPPQGLRNPGTKRTAYVYEATMQKTIGYPTFEGYQLEKPWELVPGPWIFEIWHGERKLAEQVFELVKQPVQEQAQEQVPEQVR